MSSSASAVSTDQLRPVPASDKTQGHGTEAIMGFVLLTLCLCTSLAESLIRSSTAFLSSHFGLSDKTASSIVKVVMLVVVIFPVFWRGI